jgi:hypothetical protein
MPKGLITSLLIKLTFDFWYLTLLAILIKIFLIRFTVTDSKLKIFLLWLLGSVTFYFTACMAGIIFTSLSFYTQPFIMFMLAVLFELVFLSLLFRKEYKILLPSVVIGDGIFFFLLFMQML